MLIFSEHFKKGANFFKCMYVYTHIRTHITYTYVCTYMYDLIVKLQTSLKTEVEICVYFVRANTQKLIHQLWIKEIRFVAQSIDTSLTIWRYRTVALSQLKSQPLFRALKIWHYKANVIMPPL